MMTDQAQKNTNIAINQDVALIIANSPTLSHLVSNENYSNTSRPSYPTLSLEGMYIPSSGGFSYEAMNIPFENALNGYIDMPENAFLKELENTPPSVRASSRDFLNVAFEDLFKIPVDERADEAVIVVQALRSGGVTSLERVLGITAAEWEAAVTVSHASSIIKGVVESIERDLSEESEVISTTTTTEQNTYLPPPSPAPEPSPTPSPPPEPDRAFYLTNSINPGDPVGNVSAVFSFVVGTTTTGPLVIGTPHNLLTGLSGTLLGIASTVDGPFSLTPPIATANFPGNITSVTSTGDFSYQIMLTAFDPLFTDNFYYQVSSTSAIQSASISMIQESFSSGVANNPGTEVFVVGTVFGPNVALADGEILSVKYVETNSSGPFFTEITSPMMVDISNASFQPAGATTTLLIDPTTGDFTYHSFFAGGLIGSDTISIIVGDNHGNLVEVEANIFIGFPPVVLDLNGDGISLITAEDSPVMLGGVHNGYQNHLGWVAPGDGVIMYDPNGTGKLTSVDQITFTQYVPGAKTDLEGLVAFDTNHDGQLDFGDKEFNHFGVILADGKFQTFSQLGIASLSLTSDNQQQVMNGNLIQGFTSYQTEDGQSHLAATVVLTSTAVKSGSPSPLTPNDVFIPEDQINFSTLGDTSSTAPATTSSPSEPASVNVAGNDAVTPVSLDVQTMSNHLNPEVAQHEG